MWKEAVVACSDIISVSCLEVRFGKYKTLQIRTLFRDLKQERSTTFSGGNTIS
jgi:hypothetical protein